jgi:murein DD-endopeptidase MepM/ murein hydrolase activator NlpD
MVLLLVSCATQYPESCPRYTSFDLSEADDYPENDSLPFQFPLDKYEPGSPDYKSSFAMSGRESFDTPKEYHAAEDSYDPPGTPVYAMADGRISFSGPMGGYGWLIIIDHPQANLYSLYGHLSPSRWKLSKGTDVKKGELIGYLGDPDENGGSEKNPLPPHLHFGVRAGQRADYPRGGEWRWMAGWIKFCPQNLGWLQPSVVITSQQIPPEGFPQPGVDFLTRWGVEALFTGIYSIGGACLVLYAFGKKKPFIFWIGPGVVVIVVGIVLRMLDVVSTFALPAMGILLVIVGIILFARQPKSNLSNSS